MTQRHRLLSAGTLLFAALAITDASAQEARGAGATATAAAPVVVPAGYVIGAQDVLTIRFWKDPEMSGDVIVRPDGKISLPLLNDINAAGRTPEELRDAILTVAAKFFEDPSPTVTVKEIHSRFVYITGNIAKPSQYAINNDMDVLKLITLAGGLLEYAEKEKIQILRMRNGATQYFRFNYNDIIKNKNPQQNILLQPGDQVVVP